MTTQPINIQHYNCECGAETVVTTCLTPTIDTVTLSAFTCPFCTRKTPFLTNQVPKDRNVLGFSSYAERLARKIARMHKTINEAHPYTKGRPHDRQNQRTTLQP